MYAVTDGVRYIKHTSNFGAFHGRVVLTDRVELAKLFTREKDAVRRMSVLDYRSRTYKEDEKFKGDWEVVRVFCEGEE